jgi:hypothetical protein
VLTTNLGLATRPIDTFAPFVADVEGGLRTQPLLTAGDLDKTMAMALQALLIEQDHQWSALLPLSTAPEGRGIDGTKTGRRLAARILPGGCLADMNEGCRIDRGSTPAI